MSSTDKEVVEDLADKAVTSTSIIFVIILVLKLSILNQLFSQVRSLSIVTHLMLISMKLPASVMVFYPKIFEIVAFDLFAEHLKFDEFLNWIFKFDDVPFESEDDRFEELGYQSHFMISNLSSVFVFLILTIFLQLVYLLIIKCDCCENNRRILIFTRKQHGQFKWNGAISFFNEVYLLLSITVAINMHAVLSP